MYIRRCLVTPLSTSVAALCVWGFATTASAAPPACEVPLMSDPGDAATKLRNCVDAVNQGNLFGPTEIVFEGPQSYELDESLEFQRDVVVHGYGQVLAPGANFSDESLLLIGAPCPGSNCQGTISVTIEGVELTSAAVSNVRAIDLLPGNTLTLEDGYVHGFQGQKSGGCIRARQQSNLWMHDGQIADCLTEDQGGGLFTEAKVTIIDGTTFDSNEANLGGGVFFGDGGTFNRKLRVWDAVFSDNIAENGGAIMTADGATNTQISKSRFTRNDASEQGGGFYGGADIRYSTFVSNTAGAHGGGALLRMKSSVFGSTFDGNASWRGGGVSILANGNFDMEVASSTFTRNTGLVLMGTNPSWGAGVFVGRGIRPVTTGTTFIRNSTFSENDVNMGMNDGLGGGLGLQGVAAVVEHVTFSDNDAWEGTAIYTSPTTSTDLTLRSTIVANAGSSSTRPLCDLGPTFQSETSLDTDGSCGAAFSSIDPGLAPLADNGGATATHLPTASEVLGTATCFASYDQRGDARPPTGCDIGSVQQ